MAKKAQAASPPVNGASGHAMVENKESKDSLALFCEQTIKKYHSAGWSPFPLLEKSKKPMGKWKDFQADLDHMKEQFPEGCNLGVKLGEPSGGLVDLDLDWPEARQLAREVFGNLPAFGRKGAPWSHRIAICNDLEATQKFQLPATCKEGLPEEHGLCVLEVRGTGGYTMFPPSVHPSGEMVEWHADGAPPEVKGEDLKKKAGLLAFLSVVLRFYPEKGTRDETCMALSGALLAAGYDHEETDHLVEMVAKEAGDEESHMRGKARRTKEKLEGDEPTTGLTRLVELMGLPEEVLKIFRGWLGLSADLKSEFQCDDEGKIYRNQNDVPPQNRSMLNERIFDTLSAGPPNLGGFT